MIQEFFQRKKLKPRSSAISFSDSATIHLPKLSHHCMLQDNSSRNQSQNPRFIDLRGQRIRGEIKLLQSISKSSKGVQARVLIMKKQLPKHSIPVRRRQKKKLQLTYFDRLFCKDPNLFKITLYLDFLKNINFSNGLKHKKYQALINFKAYVCKGNNSSLIKSIIKHRFWWNIAENQSQAHFVWSQNKQKKCIQNMKQSQIPFSKQQEPLNLKIKTKGQTAQALSKILVGQDYRIICQKGKRTNKNLQQLDKHTPSLKLHNHLEYNWNLCNKKALFLNLLRYYRLIGQDPWKSIPLTFHIKSIQDPDWQKFQQTFNSQKNKRKNIWIVKPGQNSNRGMGIQVHDSIDQIRKFVSSRQQRNNKRTTIIQKYIQPFLYNRRKFDFRCYMLVTSIKGIKAYWYEEGYIRTSSKQYTIKNLSNRIIHLTNDSVQKKSQDYGKYEKGNKVSFPDFQKYLDSVNSKISIEKDILPRMKQLALEAIKSTFLQLDCKRRKYTFQLFGLDYMLDSSGVIYLIQVNNNPCLQLCAPLLARIIPSVIQGTMKIAVDSIFMPPQAEFWPLLKRSSCPDKVYQSNQFTLIFDQSKQGRELQKLLSQQRKQEIHFLNQQQVDQEQQYQQLIQQ